MLTSECEDYTQGEHGFWTQVCEPCIQKHKLCDSQISPMAGEGPLCGIKDCQNEAEYYYDFEESEVDHELRS